MAYKAIKVIKAKGHSDLEKQLFSAMNTMAETCAEVTMQPVGTHFRNGRYEYAVAVLGKGDKKPTAKTKKVA